ncbi:MAG: flagellar basal-body MS-ring/collar protein FliF [Zoogloea sp.]|uniref:flagellar basal-body MS-ring/collar protein FliF n=1 Tax=Zoogloea sp. TaxID=49181 RepID=UPI0026272D0A|nr:flagellar basal-body MS-ring/collar protein FliF [Zoogloea sp.]MDD2989870.1 flagellar basal-body MS-ring/collar protein FliF [Zoogloea sp.]
MAAEEAAAPVPPASPFAQVQENIRNLSQRQKLAAGAALAFGIALIVGVLLWSRQPDYSVLFSNLAEKDGGAVVASLQQQNIPYKFSENGNAILVPATQVHDLRLRLAAQGIPKGGLVGFELMETQKLGLSQFHEQVNYQRALEGELSRTISAIASVAGARVHLAIPKQTAFLRDEQKPTASVMVNLHTGRSLDQAQIAGIVHLISSSVPNLSNDNVSVIDQDGSLLTKKPDPLRTSLDATQIKYTRELEEGYIERINAILTPLFGKGNFRAQVSADVDFNQTEQTAETYRPNPSPEQAIRSQQSNESQTRDQGPQGVPGALSNQPPVPATAPVTTPAVPGTTSASGQLPLTTSKSATINYEVDKTIQHTRKALGQIKRLSVAVAINHKEEKDKNGNSKTVPLTDEERKQVEDLVREAVGYSKDRGDTINVASSAFVTSDKDAFETPIWKDPDNIALFKELIKYLVIAGVIAFVAFGVIRPLMKQVMPPPPEEKEEDDAAAGRADGEDGEEGEEGEDEEGAEVALSPEAAARLAYDDKLAKVHEIAKNNPRVVANLIKEWMGSNEQQR